MASEAPEFCHACGGELTDTPHRGRYRCRACEDYVFHNPDPNARVAVVDGDSVLLVEMAEEGRITDPPYAHESEWTLPGGHVELGEQPEQAAARELEEETALSVDPRDLVLFDGVARQAVEGYHAAIFVYAVDRSAVSGTLDAATDASDARFWTPAELSASDECAYRELDVEPEEYRAFERVAEKATSALDGR